MARVSISSLRAEIAALREETDRLRNVGQRMSNAAFNMSQDSTYPGLDEPTKAGLKRLYKEWDGIKRTPVLNPLPKKRSMRVLMRCVHVEDPVC